MKMNLPRYSLDNPKVIWFFLAVLFIGGLVAFGHLGKKEDAPFVIKSAPISSPAIPALRPRRSSS